MAHKKDPYTPRKIIIPKDPTPSGGRTSFGKGMFRAGPFKGRKNMFGIHKNRPLRLQKKSFLGTAAKPVALLKRSK